MRNATPFFRASPPSLFASLPIIKGRSQRPLYGLARSSRASSLLASPGTGAFYPALDSFVIADPGDLAIRIEQNDDHRLVRHAGLHDQATAGFRDISGFRNADFPVITAHQRIGVMEFADATIEFDLRLSGRGSLTNFRVTRGSRHDASQVVRRREVVAGQTGRFFEAGIVHTQGLSLPVHGLNKCPHATGEVPAQGMGCAVFR